MCSLPFLVLFFKEERGYVPLLKIDKDSRGERELWWESVRDQQRGARSQRWLLQKGSFLSVNRSAAVLGTVAGVCNASVFAQQAEVFLLLGDDGLVLRPQTGGVTGEYEGVAV